MGASLPPEPGELERVLAKLRALLGGAPVPPEPIRLPGAMVYGKYPKPERTPSDPNATPEENRKQLVNYYSRLFEFENLNRGAENKEKNFLARNQLAAYMTSPFVDTLTTAMGTPEGLSVANPSNIIMGTYYPSQDVLELTRNVVQDRKPSNLRESKDWVATHEIAHRYDSKDFNGAFIYNQLIKNYHWKGAPPIPGYAGTDPGEHFAEAIASAVNMFRATALIPKDKAYDTLKGVLLTREQEFPGTTLMMAHLAAKDIYKDHPVRKAVDRLWREEHARIEKLKKAQAKKGK